MSKSKNCVSASSDDVVPEKGAALTDSCDAWSLAKYKKTVPSEGVNYKLVASLQANTHCHIQVTELLQLNKVRRHCFVVLLKNKKRLSLLLLCLHLTPAPSLLLQYNAAANGSCFSTFTLQIKQFVANTCWCKRQTSTKHQPNVDVGHTLVHTRNHRCEYSLTSRSAYHCLQLLSTYINKQ